MSLLALGLLVAGCSLIFGSLLSPPETTKQQFGHLFLGFLALACANGLLGGGFGAFASAVGAGYAFGGWVRA